MSNITTDRSKAICWFSCGAASATATIIASWTYDIEVAYCRVVEEHPDSMRFLGDFTRLTGIPVTVLVNERYEGSIYNVFRDRKFIKTQHGAPCTGMLKKNVRHGYTFDKCDRIQVFGYTTDESDRAQRFLDNNIEVNADFILQRLGFSKKDCFAFLKIHGLELPEMYKLGYNNNNCIGCVKGGMGYWNKIRKDFPETFEKMARLEREIGHAVNKDKDGPVYLDQLDPTRGRFKDDAPGDCGFTCEVRK